jgi:hypothetical protein
MPAIEEARAAPEELEEEAARPAPVPAKPVVPVYPRKQARH